MTDTSTYAANCSQRDRYDQNKCSLFEMSCAMFHSKIFNLKPFCMTGAVVNRCPYYTTTRLDRENPE